MSSPPVTPAPRGTGRARTWGLAIGFVVGATAMCLLVAVLSWPRTTVVRSVEQPESVSYSDNSQHFIVVKEHGSLGRRLLGHTSHELWLGRDPSFNYGHRIDSDITGADVDRFTVNWRSDGVQITFESGHELFVPTRSFTGGR